MYLMTSKGTMLTTFVLQCLKNSILMGEDSSIILTGSASLECARDSPNYEQFFNGKSDIDVLIVVYQDISFYENLFSENIIKSFKDDIINVLNYGYQYGNERNAINIKYIKKKTFFEWISLNEVHFKSYRKYSLSQKKPFMKCYGYNDFIIIPYQEEVVSDYFILHYDVDLKEEYYLIDIHSMILFGTLIFGNALSNSIENFNLFFKTLLNLPNRKFFNLFKYYLEDKKSIGYYELKSLVKRFTEVNTEKVLNLLKDKGIIYEVKGEVKEEAQLATICWARSNPKDVFDFMNKVSRYITSKQFILIIDDICPKILYSRTDTEQNEINQKYRNKFKKYKLYFSSDIFREALAINFMEEFIDMMKKINLNYYIDFLPEKKRSEIETVKLGEFIHTFCELFLLIYAEKVLGIDTMIFGKFSQNIIFLIKQQVFKKSKMSYIIISRLSENNIESFFQKL